MVGGVGVADGGDDSREVARRCEGKAFLLENGTHGGGGRAKVTVLRGGGLGVAVHESLAHVGASAEIEDGLGYLLFFTFVIAVAGRKREFRRILPLHSS